MSEAQNSGCGYERNLLSELFVFTGSPLSTSRKQPPKCGGQREVMHTLNSERKETLAFVFVF